MTAYNRLAPSPRYSELLALYRQMHRDGDPAHGRAPEQTFDGRSLAPHAGQIRALVARFGARSLLDYGAGKGALYRTKNLRDQDGRVHADIRTFWNIDDIVLYEPNYPPYSTYPTRRFDAVICTDVLEHVPAEDLRWLVSELFGFAEKFVFATVAGYPAQKALPNGENAHCTVRPPEWWDDLFKTAKNSTPTAAQVPWFVLYTGENPVTKRKFQVPLKG